MFSEIESTYDTTGKKDQLFLGCDVRFSQTFPFVAGGEGAWDLLSVYMILFMMYKHVYWKADLSSSYAACNLSLETELA